MLCILGSGFRYINNGVLLRIIVVITIVTRDSIQLNETAQGELFQIPKVQFLELLVYKYFRNCTYTVKVRKWALTYFIDFLMVFHGRLIKNNIFQTQVSPE